jgi:hypothetical protein
MSSSPRNRSYGTPHDGLSLVEAKATADEAERHFPHAATSATAQIKAPATACFG